VAPVRDYPTLTSAYFILVFFAVAQLQYLPDSGSIHLKLNCHIIGASVKLFRAASAISKLVHSNLLTICLAIHSSISDTFLTTDTKYKAICLLTYNISKREILPSHNTHT